MLRAVSLGHQRGSRQVLEGIDVALAPGTLTALVGPNGAGKTTLLQLLQGQLRPTEGRVELDGRPVAECRSRIALMPQRGEIAWHFPITVEDFVDLGRLRARRSGCCDVQAALQRVGMAGLARRRLDQLSGGQQQRTLLARTLVQPAEVLLLDEPMAAIDPPTREEFLRLIRQLRDAGLTLLVSSHDWGAALRAYDRVLVIDRVLLADGQPDAVQGELGAMTMGNHRCG